MAMIDPNGIMPLNFFKYKGVYTGQHNGMRYMLKQTGEKPDLKLSACVWTAERFLQPVVSNGIKLEWFFAERVAEIDCHKIPPLLFSMAS